VIDLPVDLKLCQKYVDTVEQNALSRRVSGGGAERNRRWVDRLSSTWGFIDWRRRRMAAEDGGGSWA